MIAKVPFGGIRMALISCPECGKSVSDTVKVCVHCGYRLKKALTLDSKSNTVVLNGTVKAAKRSKRFLVIGAVVIIAVMCLISISAKKAENERIARYRAEFSSETEMQELLRSGKWWLTSSGGGYTLDAYMVFDGKEFTYVDTAGDYGPFDTEYTLDYENSTVLVSGSFYYDIIEYDDDFYLRQNPKVDEDDWILHRLYPGY